MDLWIRSQDRLKLIKIEGIVLQGRTIIDDELLIGNFIIGIQSYNNDVLGEYKTKERALEVLDEIQKYIGDNFNQEEVSQFFGLNAKNKMIYEMPKE